MSNTPIYQPEPGFLSDLLFLYTYQFSNQQEREKYINPDRYAEYMDFYNDINKQFGPYDNAFAPLFCPKGGGTCFASAYFIDSDRFFCDYTLNDLCNEILDSKRILSALLRYYNDNLDDEAANDILSDFQKIFDQVLFYDIPDSLKLLFMSFFKSSNEVLSRLVDDLRKKEKQLRKYYRAKQALIIKFSSIDWRVTNEKIQQVSNKPIEVISGNVYFSTCLIRKYLIYTRVIDQTGYLLLGVDIESCIQQLLLQNDPFSLASFSKALSDVHRIDIFQFLLKGSARTSIVAKQVGLSLTAALYHLDIMVNASVLSFYSRGRAVYYSINFSYLEKAASYFEKICINERGKQYEKVEQAHG